MRFPDLTTESTLGSRKNEVLPLFRSSIIERECLWLPLEAPIKLNNSVQGHYYLLCLPEAERNKAIEKATVD